MRGSRSRLFLLCIAGVYFILFIIQLRSPYILPIHIQAKIALVSLSFAFAELIKSLSLKLEENSKDFKRHLKECIYTIEQFPQVVQNLPDVKEVSQRLQEDFDRNERKSQSKTYIIIIKLANTAIDCIYVSSIITMLLMPYMTFLNVHSPNIISSMKLLSFTLLFISIYVDEWYLDKREEQKELYNRHIENIKNHIVSIVNYEALTIKNK